MLNQPTLEKLRSLRLTGMADAFQEQLENPQNELDFASRLGLIVERECILRDNRQLNRRLKQAKLKVNACLEDVTYQSSRGINKSRILELSHCNWIRSHLNLIITRPTGCGKTWLACALAHRACLDGFNCLYLRLPRLWDELKIAKADGSYTKWLSKIAKIDVLILDDWGLIAVNDEQKRDLLEILDDRYLKRSTIITSQLPKTSWHDYLDDPTLADAILDRLLHNAINLELKGESLRKVKESLPEVND